LKQLNFNFVLSLVYFLSASLLEFWFLGDISMPVSSTARIHPSAIISSDAEIGENVEIGALAVIDGPVKIGHNSVIKPGAKLFGNLSLGAKNIVYSGAILGEAPQHMKYDGEPTKTIIGNNNIIREGVTVHRGTTSSNETVIGNGNFLMANSHVAHGRALRDGRWRFLIRKQRCASICQGWKAGTFKRRFCHY
jgi:carbonic anhydrase/acetyltransferase-like protein (isoleucine patch superfamily)